MTDTNEAFWSVGLVSVRPGTKLMGSREDGRIRDKYPHKLATDVPSAIVDIHRRFSGLPYDVISAQTSGREQDDHCASDMLPDWV